MSRIIKMKVSVIIPAKGKIGVTKTEFNNCFIIHCIFINNSFDNDFNIAPRNNVWFSKKAVEKT